MYILIIAEFYAVSLIKLIILVLLKKTAFGRKRKEPFRILVKFQTILNWIRSLNSSLRFALLTNVDRHAHQYQTKGHESKAIMVTGLWQPWLSLTNWLTWLNRLGWYV